MVDRTMRLTESWEIQQVRSRGRTAASGALVARVMPNQTNPARNRYTVITGKRVGKAHERNRCKRLVREAIRLLDPSVQQGFDLVISVRGNVQELSGLDVAMQAMNEIVRKARLQVMPE